MKVQDALGSVFDRSRRHVGHHGISRSARKSRIRPSDRWPKRRSGLLVVFEPVCDGSHRAHRSSLRPGGRKRLFA
jgi:hypothetical protein